MTPDKLPALRSATHVAFDPFTPERLSGLGASNVVRASDTLIIGPCRRDPVEHARVRKAWWAPPAPPQEPEEWDRLCSPEVHWEPPIVLWVSVSVDQRVNLWRTCSWLRHLGIASRDVFVLELEPITRQHLPEEPRAPFDCGERVTDHPDQVLLERLAEARPWPRTRYDRAVKLWDAYVDADPSRFARSCARGAKGFPELAPLWVLLSSFFPRRTSEGSLRVSRFDELILTVLSAGWQTPVAVFVHPSHPGMCLRQLLSCTGDLFLPERLNAWAHHGPKPAVERAAGPKPDHPMQSSVYRLTERGRQLLATGLDQLADAPPLPVAGTEAYAPESPWVLLDDGRLVRL